MAYDALDVIARLHARRDEHNAWVAASYSCSDDRECDRCGVPWPAADLSLDEDGYYTCPACDAADARIDEGEADLLASDDRVPF